MLLQTEGLRSTLQKGFGVYKNEGTCVSFGLLHHERKIPVIVQNPPMDKLLWENPSWINCYGRPLRLFTPPILSQTMEVAVITGVAELYGR